ncbi:RNA-binding signal recognition particle subunit SEC65 KNAG_0G03340 [Huiozyma naganishii CBS 8797]|uniref:Signal recognition particle SEC65 subunit n=1 Tax=Huiozyma naganishii (strain ATCC MYA-139 / BCRC 22969 / CBS 8797 / KCTC 17520 / NBRC 10181 / NCYC 3082 / Yp74L-3) TaxID=1071383 RepID=J7S1C0_HUIN7|nr:hypothetical protein KNAG_0G03340 [Kazachstania naganishii CBS 8797]CCK71392.1 hypothetical protein KNAG_0G03340 [Kazachstania naganishii CBS 8797]
MPKLEEIEDYDDVDNMEMDIAEIDSNLRTPIAPKIVPSVVRSQDQEQDQSNQVLAMQQRTGAGKSNGEQISFFNPKTGGLEGSTHISKEDLKEMKKFQVLYPCYFDKNRSHKNGRRVPVTEAVENPLAKTVADAVRSVGLLCVFEGEKTHPQDFGNPGRVRVLLKENGNVVQSASAYKGGKRQLLKDISSYLQAHPTTLQSLKEIPYGPDFDNIESRRIPKVKGLKMNDIVPLHSPFMMGHPMTKSLYDAPPPAPAIANSEKPMKAPKNKYKVVRR